MIRTTRSKNQLLINKIASAQFTCLLIIDIKKNSVCTSSKVYMITNVNREKKIQLHSTQLLRKYLLRMSAGRTFYWLPVFTQTFYEELLYCPLMARSKAQVKQVRNSNGNTNHFNTFESSYTKHYDMEDGWYS